MVRICPVLVQEKTTHYATAIGNGIIHHQDLHIVRREAPSARFLLPALGIGVLALLLAPTVWAAIPVFQGTQADFLVAGPTQTGGFGGNFAGGRRDDMESQTAFNPFDTTPNVVY